MKHTTYNYRTLEENIQTEKEALKISNITFEPSVIMERCDCLMATFSELYLDCEDARKDLKNEIEHRPEMVLALYNSIWTNIQNVTAMLLEMQEYTVEQNSTLHPIDFQHTKQGDSLNKSA